MKPSLADKFEKMDAGAVKQFAILREKLFELHPTIEERINKETVVYFLTNSNNFAECFLQKNRIRIQIRNRSYVDSEAWVQIVPETHLWTLNHFIIIENDSSLDYAISILRQSMNDVLP
jgi:predicted transport protein